MSSRQSPQQLVDAGVDQLSQLLGSDWRVSSSDNRTLTLRSPHGEQAELPLLVQPLQPRDVQDGVATIVQAMRTAHVPGPLLAIAARLSPRTRQALREAGASYLDLTGNVHLRVAQPTIVIETTGDGRKPRTSDARSDAVTLGGSKAARLVRLMADCAPPYRPGALAEAADLSRAYVSRLLKLLDEQLLIRREHLVVTEVDWPELLRSRAASYDLLHHNRSAGMLAPNGVTSLLSTLSALTQPWAITGHHAAREVAPLASGGQLMVYLPADIDLIAVGDELGLLQVADTSADVLLLSAHDPVVFERTRQVGGHRHVALSQLVLDSLSGPGRMPAEGEAILKHMADREWSWRLESLPRQTDQ